PRRQGETGGIVKRETPIRTCKVALYCEKCGKGVRVGYNVADGKKVRVCRKCGAEI
ncbi:MAG: 50S ribosomal protein L24, partial [Oscillospiraceae bacterium]|nr:50S ribosomal protein L24 [Oscillospiraceae bacterium]